MRFSMFLDNFKLFISIILKKNIYYSNDIDENM